MFLASLIAENIKRIPLFAVLVTLMFSPVEGRSAFEYVTSFGSSGTAFGQFAAPRGVTVNHAGKIIITESTNNRVQLCTESGSCTGFGSFGELSGEFDRPRGVAVNSVDRIFIADRGNDRIASCSETGSCTDFGGSGTTVGKFESPRGITIKQDTIYITDTDNNRVQVCDDQGACTAFGSFGSALGQFNSPAGIAVDSVGRVLVADRGNDRIQICSAQGANCSAFGSFGSAVGEFDGPAGIAVDSQDRVIVVDRFNDRVQVCTQAGSCSAFGGFGSGAGQFNLPWGVAVDSAGRIIVADLGNDRIQIFAEPAAPQVQITSFTVTANSIEEGQSVTLNWNVSDATNCTALNGNSQWRVLNPDATGGNFETTMVSAGTYTFTLQCTNNTSSDTASVSVDVVPRVPLLEMNTGLNDAWYNPVTDGQGFFITVFPVIGKVVLSWFTYDTELPPQDAVANLGDPGHRWFNALGRYTGNQGVMNIKITSGGIFDTQKEVGRVNDGTITLTFESCNSGTVEYDIPSIGKSGLVPIQRIVGDNIALCESMIGQAVVAAEAGSKDEKSSQLQSFGHAGLMVDEPALVDLNPGLNDAWYYPVTDGQGFFITIFPVISKVVLSWFTYDTELPPQDAVANLGDPGHRWFNALGTYTGNQAVVNIKMTSGGIFDTQTEVARVADGTIVLTFDTCSSGTVEYDIPSIGASDIVPIQRIVGDNIAWCESLAAEAAMQ